MKKLLFALVALSLGSTAFAVPCSRKGYEKEVLAGVEKTVKEDLFRILSAKEINLIENSYSAVVEFSEEMPNGFGEAYLSYSISAQVMTDTGQKLLLQSHYNFLPISGGTRSFSYALYFELGYDKLNNDGTPVNGRCEAKAHKNIDNGERLIVTNEKFGTQVAKFTLSSFPIYPIE